MIKKLSFVKKIKARYLLVLTLLFLVISLFALRANYEQMVSLRNAVYSADKNNGNVSLVLNNLQKYVTSHMNTNLSTGNGSIYPPIQLEYTYQRLQDQLSQQASSLNTNIYTQAEDYCQAKIPTGFSGRYRISCVEQYINTHGLESQQIPKSLYEFDFVTPFWSPDFAGWMTLITAIFGVLFILRILINFWDSYFNSK